MDKKPFNPNQLIHVQLKKILLIQTAFLGDVVLATAVLEKLAKYYPEAKIDFLVKKGNEGILEGNPKINRIIAFDKKNKIKNLAGIIKQIRNTRYDLLVNMHRFGSSGIMAFLSGARIISGFNKNPFSFSYDLKVPHILSAASEHETIRNHKLIQPFTDLFPARPKIYLTRKEYTAVDKFKTFPYLTIAPASVWYTKQWPKDKWGKLLDALTNENVTVYLLGSGADRSLCSEIKQRTNNPAVVNLAGTLSIKESAALMKDAVLNYVNDSGPMHFASAVNAPVCAVYCSTVPGFGFGPVSDFSRIAEAASSPSCRPCNVHGKKSCPMKHFSCADIEINSLLSIYKDAEIRYHTMHKPSETI